MTAQPPVADTGRPTRPATAPDRWWTLGIVTIATFMLMLDLTVVNVALPSLRTTLDASFSDLQWVLDSYALTLAVFLLTGGSLADRLGRKRVFNLGFVLFSIASLACGLATDVLTLNIARGFQGAGAAVLFAVGPALIGQAFHGKDRAMAFGVFGAGAGLALAAGPLIGGGLTDGLSWRWIFLVNVPIGVVGIAISLLRVQESRDPRGHAIDLSGLVSFSVGLTLIVLGLLRGSAEGWTSGLILGSFIGGALVLVLFFLIQRSKGERAMLDLPLFRIRTFLGISATALLYPAAVMSSIFLLVSYLQNVLGYSPWQTGLRFLPLTLVLFVVAAAAGGLTTKLPPQIMIGGAGLCLAVALALVPLLVTEDSSWTALLPTMVVAGVGLGLFNPPRAFLSIGVVEPRKAGMASGMNETFQQVGVALGIAAFGALFQARVIDSFEASAAGQQLGPAAAQASDAVAAGAIGEVVSTVPPALGAQVTEAARQAIVTGLGDALLAGAATAAIGTVLGFWLIRRSDLHESALGAVPGVPPEVADEPISSRTEHHSTAGNTVSR